MFWVFSRSESYFRSGGGWSREIGSHSWVGIKRKGKRTDSSAIVSATRSAVGWGGRPPKDDGMMMMMIRRMRRRRKGEGGQAKGDPSSVSYVSSSVNDNRCGQ